MNWLVFAIFAYVVVAIENGLDQVLAIQHVSPGFVWILAGFVAMCAPPGIVPWALLALGLLADLTAPFQTVELLDMPLIGPNCLGYLAGSYVCLQMRGMVARESPVALGVLVFTGGLFARLVPVALITLRGLPLLHTDPVLPWSAADELVRAFLGLLYTTLAALPVGYVLLLTVGLWRFAPGARGLGRARRSA